MVLKYSTICAHKEHPSGGHGNDCGTDYIIRLEEAFLAGSCVTAAREGARERLGVLVIRCEVLCLDHLPPQAPGD
jgi:hypothetical protein